jgi:hypothetical protein
MVDVADPPCMVTFPVGVVVTRGVVGLTSGVGDEEFPGEVNTRKTNIKLP